MDDFRVPKKVNRHVLKALNILCDGNAKNAAVSAAEITHQVKYQMRNLVPVPNINMAIQKSLKNLSNFGVINRTGRGKFNMGLTNIPTSLEIAHKPEAVNKNLFTRSGDSRKRNTSQLNPNSKRSQYDSEDSLSGDEYDRLRKRLRSNNKALKYTGRHVELQKSRQHNFKNIAAKKKTSYLTDNMVDQNFVLTFNNQSQCNLNLDVNLPKSSDMLYEDTNSTNNQQSPTQTAELNVVELYSNLDGFRKNDSITKPDAIVVTPKSNSISKDSVHSSLSKSVVIKSEPTAVLASKSQNISLAT